MMLRNFTGEEEERILRCKNLTELKQVLKDIKVWNKRFDREGAICSVVTKFKGDEEVVLVELYYRIEDYCETCTFRQMCLTYDWQQTGLCYQFRKYRERLWKEFLELDDLPEGSE